MWRYLPLLLLMAISTSRATEQAFPPTAPGTSEVKVLPAGVLLRAQGEGSYFGAGNRLFGPLFRYISRHEIAMTTPVEATIDRAAMYFWVAPSQVDKVAGDGGGVEVLRWAERTVASRGARGAYSSGNYERTRTELLAWLETRSDLEVTGEPYAVFWHGPFTPWFAKQYEVHVPVRERVRVGL
jgi:hypothetical protein